MKTGGQGSVEVFRQMKAEELQRILDYLPAGICVYRVEGEQVIRIVANKAYCRMVHRSEEELMGASFDAFWQPIHPDDLARTRAEQLKILEPPYVCQSTYRRIEPDGSCRWIRVEGQGAVLSQGVMQCYLWYLDVTKERMVLEESQHSRKRYEAAVEMANMVAWEYDIQKHRVVMMENESMEYDYRKFGLPKYIENVPEAFRDYIDPDDWDVFCDMYWKIEQGVATASCDVWYRMAANREPRCERITYTTVFDENGKPVKAYGVGQNITHKILEEQSYHNFMQEMLNANPESRGTFHLNLTRNQCGDGHGCTALVLEQQQDGTVDGFFQTIAHYITVKAEAEAFLQTANRAALLQAFQEGRTMVEYCYRRRIETGRVHWVKCFIHMMQNPLTGDVEAVTDAIDIEEKMRDEKILQHVTDKEFDFLALVDPQRKTLCYRSRANILQDVVQGREYSYEDELQVFLQGIADQEMVEKIAWELSLECVIAELENQGSYEVSSSLWMPDGNVRRKILRFCYLELSERVILLTQTDITQAFQAAQQHTKLLEERSEQLKTALAAAEQATRAKSEFLSRMSHDIRTPMNAIVGMSAIGQLHWRNRAKVQDCFAKIDASSQYLLSLINDILDLSRIEAGKLTLHSEAFDFKAFLRDIKTLAEPAADKRGIQFEIQVDDAVAMQYQGDMLHIQQILMNLISNAVKFTPSGGWIQLRVREKKRLKKYAYLEFVVEDTGQGMSQEFQKKMFEPFEQEAPSKARDKVGSGLGLSIVHHLINLMGGTIQVRSQKGQGTAFFVELPLQPVAENLQVIPAVRPVPRAGLSEMSQGRSLLAGQRVLLVEDNELNLEIAVELLQYSGLIVDTAVNGKLALEKVAASVPGYYFAVLMDIRMPVMDGLQATRAIRALARPDTKRLPILAMTADAFEEDRRRALNAGMNGYTVKPFQLESLLQELEKYR